MTHNASYDALRKAGCSCDFGCSQCGYALASMGNCPAWGGGCPVGIALSADCPVHRVTPPGGDADHAYRFSCEGCGETTDQDGGCTHGMTLCRDCVDRDVCRECGREAWEGEQADIAYALSKERA